MKHHISPPEPIVARVHMDATLVDNNECDSANQFISLTPKESKTWQQFGCCSYCLTMCCGTFLCPPSFLLPPSFPSSVTAHCALCIENAPDPLLPSPSSQYSLQNRHKQAPGSVGSQGLQVYHSVFPKLRVCMCEHSLEEEWLWITLNMVI